MKDVPAIIADIIRARKGEWSHAQSLDAEIDRFVILYEAEKSVIDVAHRDELEAARSEAERERLWRGYERRIRTLQDKALADVEAHSVSVLHEVMPAVMSAR